MQVYPLSLGVTAAAILAVTLAVKPYGNISQFFQNHKIPAGEGETIAVPDDCSRRFLRL